LANVPRRWARQAFTTLALVFSVITAGWVAVTAHSGGLAVYEEGVGTILAMRDRPSPGVAAATSAATQPAQPTQTAAWPPAQSVSYVRDIRPLLETKCSECHAGGQLKGGFDVSTVASIIKGGKKTGTAIVPGKPEQSPILQYLDGRKSPQMPKGGKALDPSQIALIRQWIEAGAVDDTKSTVASGAPTPAPPAPPQAITTDRAPQPP